MAQPHVGTAALAGMPLLLVLVYAQLVLLEAILLPMAQSHVRTALLALTLPPTAQPCARTAVLAGMPLLLVLVYALLAVLAAILLDQHPHAHCAYRALIQLLLGLSAFVQHVLQAPIPVMLGLLYVSLVLMGSTNHR